MLKAAVLQLIRWYQETISRARGPSCRYVPSCSEYGYQAIDRYGVWRGGWLTVKRIARCHPWHASGYDPVR